MTNTEKLARTYRLPNPSTPEDLEMRFSGMDGKTLTFGDKVLVAGYYYNGRGANSYYAATYTFLDDDHDCESAVELTTVSEEFFEDDGHAIAWAIAQH
jgi:hypothetical protein